MIDRKYHLAIGCNDFSQVPNFFPKQPFANRGSNGYFLHFQIRFFFRYNLVSNRLLGSLIGDGDFGQDGYLAGVYRRCIKDAGTGQFCFHAVDLGFKQTLCIFCSIVLCIFLEVTFSLASAMAREAAGRSTPFRCCSSSFICARVSLVTYIVLIWTSFSWSV